MIKHAFMLGLAVSAAPLCAAPESFTIDSRHTYPRWAVSHHGFSIYRGQFNKTSGKLIIDWAAKAGSVSHGKRCRFAAISSGPRSCPPGQQIPVKNTPTCLK